MTSESKQLTVLIERAPAVVYDYVSEPAHLAEWAPGLGSSVIQVDGRWFVETDAGRVGVEFAPRNEYGVLDHYVAFPTGDVFYNPMRVTANGDGSEVVFSVRRLAGMTDDEFERDAGLVAADLDRLRRILESRR
ncbi:SRPBCC family protein [Cellulomonas alba]|uniref:SRPBCC family protein n=1 Tax=Cellulomonas alba TaxID=3053467 RepID=A0ABT7SI30_9CELL|nr:SRPBCC family protein [Cellulomonas alba]MDM7855849.1 SRPBCC family protein [Cellulomonas alba]